jgi:hypothetical protein
MSTTFHELNDHGLVEEEKAKNAHMVQYIQEILNRKAQDNSSYPREVQIYFYLWKVHNIDTVAQSFSVTITASATWVEDDTKKNFQTEKNPDEHRWIKSDFGWHPQISFRNVIEEDDLVQDEWFRVRPYNAIVAESTTTVNVTKQDWKDKFSESNEPLLVTHYIKKKITLSEAFELQNFPFDLQPLHVQIASSWDCNNVVLTFNKVILSAMDPNSLDSQEWDLLPPRLIAHDMDWCDEDLPLLSLSSQSISGARYPRVHIALTASRKPQYYMWNIYVMLLILGSLSFTTFSVDVEETGDRLGIMLTLVLALIAFKLVLAQQLPSISYLTMMDVYTLGSMLLMFFISVFTSLMPSLGLKQNTLLLVDKVIMIISASLWALVNLWFLWNVDRLSKKRKFEIRDIKRKFQEYRQKTSHKPVSTGYKPLLENLS